MRKERIIGVCAAVLMGVMSLSSSAAETVPFRQGDVNRDGQVDTGDALLLLRHAAEIITLSEEDVLRLDQNFDGKLDSGDALVVLRKAAELWTPPEWVEASAETPLPEDGRALACKELQDFRVYGAPVQRGLYVARSMDELQSIWALFGEVYVGNETAALADVPITAEDFVTQDVLVMVRVAGGSNTERKLSQVTRTADHLVVHDTTVYDEHPTPDLNVRMVLIRVNKQDMQGVCRFSLNVQEQLPET